MPWQIASGSANDLLLSIGIDLNSVAHVQAARESMLHRHLYAHNIGVIDDQYIKNWQDLTGEDLTPFVAANGYPADDCYWFRPLEKLPSYIEDLRRFVSDLP